MRMDGLPVFLGPGLERLRVRRVEVDATNDHGPCRIPAVPRGLGSPYLVDRAVYGVDVRNRKLRRRRADMLNMQVDRAVGQFLDEVGCPVPLHALREQWVEQALQGGEGHGPHPVEDGWG